MTNNTNIKHTHHGEDAEPDSIFEKPTISTTTVDVLEASGDIVYGSFIINNPQNFSTIDIFQRDERPFTITQDRGVGRGGMVLGGNGMLIIYDFNKDTGEVKYKYKENGKADDHSRGDDSVIDKFFITGHDMEGNRLQETTLKINILDTQPIAEDDTDSMVVGDADPAEGNVLTAEGTTNNLGVDFQNADKVAVISVNSDNQAQVGAGEKIIGQYGTITIQTDGSYTYDLDETNAIVQALNGSNTLAEVFTYTIKDGDGDVSTANLTITINPNKTAIVDLNSTVTLSEEGLVGGAQDDLGDTDSTNATTKNGDFGSSTANIVFGDDQASSIGGTEVQWNGAGTDTITAYQDVNNNNILDSGEEVLTATINDDGTYNVSLLDAVNHLDTTTEDTVQVDLNIASNANGQLQKSGTLSVVIEDDSPAVITESVDIAVPPIDVNLMLVLDTSGSMDNSAPGLGGISKLDALKIACKSAIEKYEDYGSVKVRLVTFASKAHEISDVWLNVEDALDHIDSLEAGGFTNYDDALIKAQNAFLDDGKIDGGINRSFFITDGRPTAWVDENGNYHANDEYQPKKADQGIQLHEQAEWEKFAEDNDVNSWAVTLETPTHTDELHGIAHNGSEDDTHRDGEYVAASELKEYLLNGIDVGVSQKHMVGEFGADGGHIQTVVLDGVTYDYDLDTNTVTSPNNNSLNKLPNVVSVNQAEAQLTLQTSQGGEITIDFNEGTYDYKGSSIILEDYQENLTFTVLDNDGDTVTEDVTLNVYRADARNDNVITNQSDVITIDQDVLVANDQHNDSYTFTNTNKPVGISIQDSDEVSFTIANDKQATIIKEDASDDAQNDTNGFDNAYKINDSKFGETTDSTAPSDTDFNWVRYDGTIKNNNLTDYDVVEINVKKGEKVTLDVDGGDGQGDSVNLRLLLNLNGNDIGTVRSGDSVDAGSEGQRWWWQKGTNDPYYNYTATEDGVLQVAVRHDSRRWDNGDYKLWIGKDGDAEVSGSFEYELNQGGVTDTAAVNVTQVTGDMVHGAKNADVDETLVGRDGQYDRIYGDGGDDVLDGGAGADLMYAGQGDDVIFYNQGDYADGEWGNDTLKITDSGDISLDSHNINNIEKIELSDDQNHNLAISVSDVVSVTDSGNTLFIDGDSKDSVELSGLQKVDNPGTYAEDGYTMYTNSGDTYGYATLYVQNDIVM